VFYRLDYQIGTGPVSTLWAFRGRYDSVSDNVDVDLASLMGQNVRFILTILSNGSSTNDRALWIAPRIANSGSAPAPTSTNTPTPTPSTAVPTLTPTATSVPPTSTPIPPTATPDPYAGWGTYNNSVYGFTFRTPPGSTIGTGINNATRIFLPFTSGTNLMEKYVDVTATENASVCNAGQSMTSETVTINGIQFLKQTAMEGAAGNLYNWYAYSAYRPGTTVCVTMMFVLHSISPGAMETPLPTFDLAAESAVIDTIMSTYAWTTATANLQPDSATFCADPQATTLLQNLETAVKTSNGDLLASLVSPNHGVDVRLWHYGNTVNYNATQARSAFTDISVIDWGVHPGSLLPTIGTFTEKVLPTLVDVFAATRQFKCNDPNVLTLTNTFPWNVNFYQIFRPATASDTFDMNYWLVGMEYIGGKPYLYGMIHHIWTP
jgi:hypothetical protein